MTGTTNASVSNTASPDAAFENGKARPKTNSKTRAKTSAVAAVPRLTLFGSPQLLQGEDDGTYHELLSRVRAAVKPVDVIDEMFIADAVSLEWDVLRWRRFKATLMRMHGLRALEDFLNIHLDNEHYSKFYEEDLTEILQEEFEDQTEARRLAQECAHGESRAIDRVSAILERIDMNILEILSDARFRKAKELAQDYARHKSGAIKLINKLLARCGSNIDALMVTAMAKNLDDIERIDRLITIAENRRNGMLREIDRRRAVLGEALRRQVQEVEGEFQVVDKTPEAKSAA
jgi:hypothetical protein